MTFNEYEISIEGSQPVETYKIVLGSSIYRYTSAEDDQVISGETYTAYSIKRNRVGKGREIRGNILELTVPGNNEIAMQYASNLPGLKAEVTVHRFQRPDGITPENIMIFKGRIGSVRFTEDVKKAILAVQPIGVALSREMPRYCYSAQCNHMLYEEDTCGVAASDPAYKYSGLVSVVSANTIIVPGASSFTDGWFTAGKVEALSGSDARLITNHTGNNIKMLLPFPFSAVGQAVDLYAGCAHTIAICKTKFDNVINFGGWPFVPTKNIFQDGLI